MSSLEHAILSPGERVGNYEAVRRVGVGGMGEVWEARHSALKKRVALKILLPEHARSPEVTARFLREGEAASRIRHPHAVEVFDVGAHRGLPYLVMELLEGRDLDQWLHDDGVLSVEAAADIVAPVVAAIAAAHDEGVVHRDLKPGNIHLSITRDGVLVPKVLDFGISRVDGSGDVRTASATVLGTPMYMSPEQTRGASDATHASDQYAIGVILYECVTGRPPFDAPTVFGLIARIGTGEYMPPHAPA
ncbi:MAG: serine/threonine-protein kinase [Polyangiales bacterium]